MIAEVVGATHKPIPALVISNDHTRSRYVDPASRKRMQKSPSPIRNRPSATATRSPTRGRYRCIVAPKTMIGTASGVSANAV
jgi:hypothetical protein